MSVLIIEVPAIERSISRVVLDRRAYLIGFEYNSLSDSWSFNLYNMQNKALAVGIAIVPHFPLNIQVVDEDFPKGYFGVKSNLEHIGKDSFTDNRAEFRYVLDEL